MVEGEREISISQPTILTLPSPTETPAFLFKLWKALEATEYSQYISWSNNGNSFIIHDQNQFSRVVLPNFFKHSHFTSFVRQLNMYGFRKLTNTVYSSATSGQESMEFHHPQFIKGHPNMLEFVKRKSPSSFRIGSRTIRTTDLEKLITDFEHIKFEHEKVLRETNDLRNENTSLRSEVLQLKNKYSRHEQVLTRMMNFIILNALYPERTPSLLPGIKRRRKMIQLKNNSQTLAIPESMNAPISLNSNYDVHTARSLLQPLDASNIPYQPYFNVDGFHTQEAPRNSLTLYNANYQGGVPSEEYSLALNPRQIKDSLHQQKEPYIRDDVRKAILAKTGALNDEVIQPSREPASFPMFPDQNDCYTNEYENPEFEQYMHQDDENSVDFPEGFDSTMLSEFLLPNPTTLEGPPLPNINNLPVNSDLFNASLLSDTDQIRYRMMHGSEDHNEDTQSTLYPLPSQKRI